MIVTLHAIVLSLLVIPSLAALNVSFASYDNDFIEPSYILNKKWSATTVVAQESIVQWADWLATQGPWSVTTSKSVLAPSNDSHDYLSWAPNFWPNCTGVGNTTELTPQQVWVTCPYIYRDDKLNPDVRTVNNTGAFDAMADAVLYNTLAWAINGSSQYATNVASWINTWFLANDTYMNPNLNYTQMVRGPAPNAGNHTGVLDLKCMVKVANAALVLREGSAPGWTSAIDSGLVTWTKSYIEWLTTNQLGLAEAAEPNNHGSYYYNQLAALQILVDDTTSAKTTIQKYFSTLYVNQINATGEQPLEAARGQQSYHYRAYNLAAMITNARLGAHVGFDAWNVTSSSGNTIQSALDFAMIAPEGNDDPMELYPSIGAVAAVYGDYDSSSVVSYSVYLSGAMPNYPAHPWFFWDQPLSDSGWVRAQGSKGKNDGERVSLRTAGRLFLGAATSALLHVLLFL